MSHVARLALTSLDTLDLLTYLHLEHIVPLSAAAFETPVVVEETTIRRSGGRAYVAPVGTSAPASIDDPFGEEWQALAPGMGGDTAP